MGYFVLGPTDLYKLVKEIGKFVQNFQTFTSEATASFENNLESQLQLEEIRKAQRELTDAFSFRRSINVDEDTEAFEVNAQSPRIIDGGGADSVAAVAGGGRQQQPYLPMEEEQQQRVMTQPSQRKRFGVDVSRSSRHRVSWKAKTSTHHHLSL